jgi:hypothetical protein
MAYVEEAYHLIQTTSTLAVHKRKHKRVDPPLRPGIPNAPIHSTHGTLRCLLGTRRWFIAKWYDTLADEERRSSRKSNGQVLYRVMYPKRFTVTEAKKSYGHTVYHVTYGP